LRLDAAVGDPLLAVRAFLDVRFDGRPRRTV
jgi:hypothetical protein